MDRNAGILLPISSLPSPYGIGTLGKAAREWIQRLREAGQTYWQVLPVGPTGYGDSPYQSFSAFAGNPYLIDLDLLVQEGLLTKRQIGKDWGENPERVDYGKMYQKRFKVLHRAFLAGEALRKSREYKDFFKKNAHWLPEYALYMSVKSRFQGKAFCEWEESIRLRKPEALRKYRKECKEEIDFWCFCQFLFFRQWKQMRAYAKEQGIRLIGDMPLYVAYDSADVWVHSDLFQMDQERRPLWVAGVPPDYFSKTGQRWGNPIYHWKKMEETGFLWWKERLEAMRELYDVVRLDHFIGIARYYRIPANAPTAATGNWEKGPGKKFLQMIQKMEPAPAIIAENLGVLGPEVRRLIKTSGYPGMKVLLFAFDGKPENEYLPHNYKDFHCIVYGGTHDNETIREHFTRCSPGEWQEAREYLGIGKKSQAPDALLRLAYASVGETVIFQMQDLLHLGKEGRMNRPGCPGGNWQWRMKPGAFDEALCQKLLALAEQYNR